MGRIIDLIALLSPKYRGDTVRFEEVVLEGNIFIASENTQLYFCKIVSLHIHVMSHQPSSAFLCSF